MRDEATVEVLCLLSDFEKRFRWVTYFTLGRIAARVDPYIGQYGYRRVSPSLVRRYREGTLERAVAQAALAMQEFEAALGRVLGYEDIGIPVHHLCREGRFDEDEQPSAAAQRVWRRVRSSMDDVVLRALGARSFRGVTVDWAERYEPNTTERRVADTALALQAFEAAFPRVLDAGPASSPSARAVRVRDETSDVSARP